MRVFSLHIIIIITFHVIMNTVNSQDKQDQKNKMETTTLGGGCFWCIEALYQRVEGVKSVVSGYSGGKIKNPTYKEVCSGNTGHAEVVQIKFDSSVVSYLDILEVFFQVHDPTTLNRQGNDIGSQYRSVIFYHTDEQKTKAEQMIRKLTESKIWSSPIVTVVEEFQEFYKAEDYHQDYYRLNPESSYCKYVILPKVEKFEKLIKD